MSDRHTHLSPFGATDKLTRRAWGTLLVLCGALFLDALDVSMMGVALPSIRTDLDMSTSSLQWVVSAYVLGYGGFLLLGGRAADLLGRRRVFLIALGVFIVASVLGGLANDGTVLIVTRFIKGVSAAFTAPAALSIITTTFAEGPARNKALVDLHRHRRDRVLARARDRRPADRDRLALGVLPPRAGRARHAARRASGSCRGPPARRAAGAFDVAGAVSMTGGDAAARLHARRGARRRLALGPDARLARRRRRDPGRVRLARAQRAGAARAPRHPPLGLARAGEPRRDVAVRRLGRVPVRRHALPAAAARLVGARDRPGDLPGRAARGARLAADRRR